MEGSQDCVYSDKWREENTIPKDGWPEGMENSFYYEVMIEEVHNWLWELYPEEPDWMEKPTQQSKAYSPPSL